MSGAFDLLSRPLVFIPVEWPGLIEGADGAGVPTTHTVDMQVEILEREELQAWIDLSKKDASNGRLDLAAELEIVKTVAKGWRKIKANNATPVFNDENLLKLIRWPGFIEAFTSAYFDAWNGRVKAREGNSEGSPANGRPDEPTAATPKGVTSAS
jgi:hypothetical protein